MAFDLSATFGLFGFFFFDAMWHNFTMNIVRWKKYFYEEKVKLILAFTY